MDDHGHLHGLLVEKHGNKVVYDSRLALNAKVKEVIANNQWRWSVSKSL